MSYILEALRKSERERNAAQAPSLPAGVMGETVRRPSWPVWLVALIVALNFGTLGYFWLRGVDTVPSPNSSAVPDTHPSGQNPAPAAPVSPPALAVQPVPGSAEEAAQPPIPQAATAKNPAPRPLPRRAGENTVSKPQVNPQASANRSSTPAKTEAPLKPSSSAAKTAEAADKPSRVAETDADRLRPTFPSTGEGTEKSGTEPDSSALPSRPEAPSAPSDDIPFLESLPANVQQRLLPLKINLFAYSSVPAERFAVIDMKRYKVGDALANGVQLVEIRSDSLVLKGEGMTFRVRRP